MRFATKFDRWIVVVLLLTATLTCVVLPVARWLAPGSHPAPVWLAWMAPAIWLVILPCMLPQYYEVRENGRFLRQGWRKSAIPYSSLVEIQSMSDFRSAGVFSTDRLQLTTLEGKSFVIAPAEQERFLDEVGRRTPQLERKGFGLALN